MFLLGFLRKLTAPALCKSIESAIQWFQIHHKITFATIHNPAVYLSGARVSVFSTLVPQLYYVHTKKNYGRDDQTCAEYAFIPDKLQIYFFRHQCQYCVTSK